MDAASRLYHLADHTAGRQRAVNENSCQHDSTYPLRQQPASRWSKPPTNAANSRHGSQQHSLRMSLIGSPPNEHWGCVRADWWRPSWPLLMRPCYDRGGHISVTVRQCMRIPSSCRSPLTPRFPSRRTVLAAAPTLTASPTFSLRSSCAPCLCVASSHIPPSLPQLPLIARSRLLCVSVAFGSASGWCRDVASLPPPRSPALAYRQSLKRQAFCSDPQEYPKHRPPQET